MILIENKNGGSVNLRFYFLKGKNHRLFYDLLYCLSLTKKSIEVFENDVLLVISEVFSEKIDSARVFGACLHPYF